MKLKPPAEPISEINVTPFIDIMLVLLIIFMIVAKVSQTALDIELPGASGAADERKLLLEIAYGADGLLFVNNLPVAMDDLPQVLARFSPAERARPVRLAIDKSARYEALIAIMDALKAANFAQISLAAAAK